MFSTKDRTFLVRSFSSTWFITKCNVGLKKLLTWDVGQHGDDEAVVVVEGHVIHVGESHGVHSSPAYEWQSSINGHQFSDDSQGVQDDEEVVSAEEKRTFNNELREHRCNKHTRCS